MAVGCPLARSLGVARWSVADHPGKRALARLWPIAKAWAGGHGGKNKRPCNHGAELPLHNYNL